MVDANVRSVCYGILTEGAYTDEFERVFSTAEAAVPDSDFGEQKMETAPIQEDIVVEIPQAAEPESDVRQIQLDAYKGEDKVRKRLRALIVIAIIAAVFALVMIYLPYH